MTTVSLKTSDDYVWGGNSGAHGNIYQRDLAFVLFVRGTMKKRGFKLATEMKVAGKFDDVIMYVEELDETWLFQAKHVQLDASNPNKISEKELFPFEEHLQGKDFDLFKYMQSYFHVESEIKGKKRYFIFTNKDLEESKSLGKWIRDASGEVDDLMIFSDFSGAYKTFELDENDIAKMLPMGNVEFYKIKNAIVKVFKTGNVDKVLFNYKTPLAKILCVRNKVLRFTNDFIAGCNGSTSIVALHKLLLGDFEPDLSSVEIAENAEIKSLLDSRNSRNQQLPIFLDERMMMAFFKSLTFCVNQPNELRIIVDQDIGMWLRTWVRPDYLGKFSESQLKLPVTKFDDVFKGWHEPDMKGVAKSKNKSLLCSNVGIECWDMIIKELEQFTIQLPGAVERYYINRKVFYLNAANTYTRRSGISDKELGNQLTESSNEDKCIALIADPGMGKTTLMQYVSFEVQKLISKSIFLIYLSSLKDKLLETSECRNLSEALDIIGSAVSVTNNSLLKKTFIDKTDKENKEYDVYFFLDGFDEVPAPGNPKLISVIQQLLRTQKVRIVISGRKHVENDLRMKLAVKVMYLEPFRSDNQIIFLEKYWKISREDIFVYLKFQNFAKKLLNRFNANTNSFMEMPLMIRLLAEVFKDDLEGFLKSEDENDTLEALSTEEFSVVSLFDQFVRKSFWMKMCRKFGLDPYLKNASYDDELNVLFYQYVVEHELAAINVFNYLPEMQGVLVHAKKDNSNEEKYDNFRKRIKDGEEKSLLINLSGSQIQFVHQSIAEYFVAQYLYNNLPFCVDYICSILENMRMVRNFFFWMLEAKQDQCSILSSICELNKLVAFWACEAMCLGVLKSLSRNHDLRTFFSEEHGSLLHVAAQNGSCEICRFLLEDVKIKANCLSTEKLGNSMGFFQPSNSFEEQLSIGHQVTALHLAAAYDHKEFVELLLEHSVDVNAQNENLFTPLHLTAKKGRVEMMKLLIDHSADLNRQTNDGDTPLHLSIRFNEVLCAEILIDHKANVCISNEAELTPLILAVRKGFPNIVAQLISAVRSQVGNEDIISIFSGNKRSTLLHLAAKSGNLATVEQIIPLSTSIDAPDSSGATPLSYAASGGHADIVKYFIDRKCSVNASETGYSSPLHMAIMSGSSDVVKLLIDHLADVHYQNSSGTTALHLAAESTNFEIMELLLKTAADVNAVNVAQKTALHLAAMNNKPRHVELLLKHSADPTLVDIVGWTPLHFAAHQGSLEAVALLIDQPIDINARTSEARTPLHLAAISGYQDVVEILIRKSADLNSQDNKKWTPLHVAINFGNIHILNLLINSDNVNSKDRQNLTPLLLAAQKDIPVKCVKFLIEKQSNVNASKKDGWTVLHWAAERGHFDIAELLLDRSASANAQDTNQRTPLHQAAANGHASIIRLLIGHSAVVTHPDKDKNTPLHLATEKGHRECVKLLINATVDTTLHLTHVNAINKRKWTPLHLAAHHGYPEITQLLIDTASESVVDAQDKEGNTPLHAAAKNGHLDVAKILINESANIVARNKQKWTPLHLAALSGHKELVDLLLTHSAEIDARDRNGNTPLDLASSSFRTEVVRLLSGLSGSE